MLLVHFWQRGPYDRMRGTSERSTDVREPFGKSSQMSSVGGTNCSTCSGTTSAQT